MKSTDKSTQSDFVTAPRPSGQPCKPLTTNPTDGQELVIEPEVVINPQWNNVVYSGLPASPQPPATAQYQLDHGTGSVGVLTRHDEGGNVRPNSEPITLTLDNLGPVLTARQNGQLLAGTAGDGSGVAKLELSLDGGVHYRPIALVAADWSFDMAGWSGDPAQDLAVLRAVGVWGNVTRRMAPVDSFLIPTSPPGP